MKMINTTKDSYYQMALFNAQQILKQAAAIIPSYTQQFVVNKSSLKLKRQKLNAKFTARQTWTTAAKNIQRLTFLGICHPGRQLGAINYSLKCSSVRVDKCVLQFLFHIHTAVLRLF